MDLPPLPPPLGLSYNSSIRRFSAELVAKDKKEKRKKKKKGLADDECTRAT